MKNVMRAALVLTVVCAAIGIAEGYSQRHAPRHAPAHASDTDPHAMFARNCGMCHTAPDPAFATDRAWLDQVNRTA